MKRIWTENEEDVSCYAAINTIESFLCFLWGSKRMRVYEVCRSANPLVEYLLPIHQLNYDCSPSEISSKHLLWGSSRDQTRSHVTKAAPRLPLEGSNSNEKTSKIAINIWHLTWCSTVLTFSRYHLMIVSDDFVVKENGAWGVLRCWDLLITGFGSSTRGRVSRHEYRQKITENGETHRALSMSTANNRSTHALWADCEYLTFDRAPRAYSISDCAIRGWEHDVIIRKWDIKHPTWEFLGNHEQLPRKHLTV